VLYYSVAVLYYSVAVLYYSVPVLYYSVAVLYYSVVVLYYSVTVLYPNLDRFLFIIISGFLSAKWIFRFLGPDILATLYYYPSILAVTCKLSFNPLTPELNLSTQRCLTKFLLRILLLEPCISLIYA
jgi:hypothetical protein